jgi:transcriptional regulator with XRE-family HTH domain
VKEPNRLRAARLAAGWSQPRLIAAMRAAAPALDLSLPTDESAKTNIKRWEHGTVVPGIEYRRLFQRVYGMTADQLGFPPLDEDAVDHFGGGASALSKQAIDYYGSLFDDHVRADNLLGPRFTLDIVRQQVNTLGRAAREARGPHRARVLWMASRYYEFYGWLLQDLGRCMDATVSTDRARDLALELDDQSLIAYLMMRRSNIATDDDDPGLAAALADAALTAYDASPKRNIRAVLLRQKANAYAGLGQTQKCASAIGEALDFAEASSGEATELADYCTPSYAAMEAGTCWLRLGNADQALTAFSRASTDWNPELRRDQGLSLARRATAQAGVGDVGTACGTGHEALAAYVETRSARTLKELIRLRATLVPWSRDPQVVALRRAIASLAAVA